MSLPHQFATQPAGTVPASFLDDNFNAVGNGIIVPCTATGTNAIALTPLTNYPTITSYFNYGQFSFVAAANSTGLVTVNISGVGASNLYLPTGAQVTTGQIAVGQLYTIAFNQALNTGSGGFQLVSAGTGAVVTGTPTAGHVAVWASASSIQDGGVPPVLHTQVFLASGTFTTPSNTLSTTVFKFIVTGGGGGGFNRATFGAAGGTAIYFATGLSASTGYAVTVGAAGAYSASSPTAGGASSVVLGATTVTGNGGGAATGSGTNILVLGGTATNGTINLLGGSSFNTAAGASYWGGCGAYGAGGGQDAFGLGPNSGNGGSGVVMVEWVL